jgi:hypothetical protein
VIFGYRRYQITYTTDVDPVKAITLKGAYDTWSSVEMTAECRLGRPIEQLLETSHQVCFRHLTTIAESCHCGIYVVKGPDMIPDYSEWPILAQVVGWGGFVEYEYGWRIQYCRIEQMWLDSSQEYHFNFDAVETIEFLRSKYNVPVKLLTGAVCCGQNHEMGYWPSKNGPISICQMATSHIANALKFLDKAARRDRSAAKWQLAFQQELKRREPKKIGDKTIVRF